MVNLFNNAASRILLSIAAAAAVFVLPACVLQSADSAAQSDSQRPTGMLLDTITYNGKTHNFAVYVPRQYATAMPASGWPVILSLNGRGECGLDGQRQSVVGLGSACMLQPDKYPFIIVFPQKPDADSQWIQHDQLALGCLDQVVKKYRTDPNRVYLTGLSQGGAGTWAIAAKHPARFAAIAPVCGYGDASQLAPPIAAAKLPVWAFHGLKDDVVPATQSEVMVSAINAAGGNATLKLYPDANHNSWDSAYRNENLGAWFLQHRRTP